MFTFHSLHQGNLSGSTQKTARERLGRVPVGDVPRPRIPYDFNLGDGSRDRKMPLTAHVSDPGIVGQNLWGILRRSETTPALPTSHPVLL